MPYARYLRYLGLIGLCVLLTSCGFHLRGVQDLAFQTLYIDLPDNSPLRADLSRQIQQFSQTQLVNEATGAEAKLIILDQRRTQEQLTLDGLGRVRDYNLFYTLSFKLLNQQGEELIGPTDITVRREITHNDTQLIAKEFERNQLFRNMQQEVAQKLMRRLQAVNTK